MTTTPRAWLLLSLILACGEPANPDASTTDAGTTHASTGSSGADATSTADSTTGGTPTTSSGASSGPGTTGVVETTSGSAGTTDLTSGTTSGTSTGEASVGDTTSTDTLASESTSGGSTGGESTSGGADSLGVISGDCGVIAMMDLESPMAYVFTGAIDFGDVGFDYALLTPGGQQMFDEGNLNSGSLESEIVAYEVLARCEMAELLKTEGKIVYDDPMGKKTDLLVEMDGLKVGVSVARAVGFPKDDPYTVQQATTILKKKLGDISISSANVAPEDAWVKQILSVVAYAPGHVDSLLAAYAALDPAVKADTILVITVSEGDDVFIYD